jgi:hypothetical protein
MRALSPGTDFPVPAAGERGWVIILIPSRAERDQNRTEPLQTRPDSLHGTTILRTPPTDPYCVSELPPRSSLAFTCLRATVVEAFLLGYRHVRISLPRTWVGIFAAGRPSPGTRIALISLFVARVRSLMSPAHGEYAVIARFPLPRLLSPEVGEVHPKHNVSHFLVGLPLAHDHWSSVILSKLS